MTVALHGKRDFADMIKLGVLRWEACPGLSNWAQGDDKGSSKRESNKMEAERKI